jgi:hypothetical protein
VTSTSKRNVPVSSSSLSLLTRVTLESKDKKRKKKLRSFAKSRRSVTARRKSAKRSKIAIV